MKGEPMDINKEYLDVMAEVKGLKTQLDTLVTLLFDGASLTYNKKGMNIGNDSIIMAYLKAIRPRDYRIKLEELQEQEKAKEGEEDGK